MSEIIGSIITSPEFASFVIGAFGTVAGAIVGSILYLYRRVVLHRLSDQEQALLERAAKMAVLYVEQIGADKKADEKLNLALESAATALRSWGITVEASQLRAAIEAAVMEYITRFSSSGDSTISA